MNLILTINAGSSSIKFAAFQLQEGQLRRAADGHIEGIGATAMFFARKAEGEKTEFVIDGSQGPVGHDLALGAVLDWLEEHFSGARVLAVGHRVVHGGPNFAEPLLLDRANLALLRQLEPLAPLHQPHNIAGIEAAMLAFPDAFQAACFDTAFHRSHPFIADTFALPHRFYEEGIRRYGFHGLSYEYISRRLRALEPVLATGRVIVAHLGNGASLCALRSGRSIASTMGFTALDGMPMGTRCGQLDPGVVLYLMAEKKMSAAEITELLYKNSGLKGMSGHSNDMRVLEASDAPEAREAIDYFVSRVRREVGGLAAAIGGLDAVVFTGGIGENDWRIREAVLGDLGWIGVHLDSEANRSHAQVNGAKVISTADSPVKVLVLATDEERMIADHTAEVAGFIRMAKFFRGAHARAPADVPV
jgi:acetate kinase